MKDLLRRAEAAAVFLLSFPISLLPCKAGELLGLLLFWVWKSRREIAIDNIRRSSLPSAASAEEIARGNCRNYGRSLVEVFKVYHGLGKVILDRTSITGLEHFRAALAKGKGVLLVTGHCGNWELLAVAASYKVSNISVVARPLDNPYLNRLIERARARYGNRVISKKGALREILSTFRKGGVVGILMDQAVLSEEGYIIDFLGRGAWTTKMPALIARKTGVPVVPAFIRRKEGAHEITIHPEVALSTLRDLEEALREDTKNFSAYIEEYIRQNPAEWLWMHQRWKRVPQGGIGCGESGAGGAA